MKKLILLMSFMCFWVLGNGQKNILLDNYYNHEIEAETGKAFHYLWNDEAMSGFSELGKLFKDQGSRLLLLQTKPNRCQLKRADVYIIVDPDTQQESENPKFMDRKAAARIAKWVKRGGVLLVLANDSENCELEKLNLLMSLFGMKFNHETLHLEKPGIGETRNFDSCASINLPDHPLFRNVDKIFLKGISSISCEGPAAPVLQEDGKILMAEAAHGRGRVLAIGDPWLYNEYINHRFLPEDFGNYQAAKNLVAYLLGHRK